MAISKNIPGAFKNPGAKELKEAQNEIKIEEAQTQDTLAPIPTTRRRGLLAGLEEGSNAGSPTGYIPQDLEAENRIQPAGQDIANTVDNEMLLNQVEEDGDIGPLVQELTDRELLDDQGLATVTGDPVYAANKLNQELNSQQDRQRKDTASSYEANTGAKFKQTIPNGSGSKTAYDNLLATGALLGQGLTNTINPTLRGESEIAFEVQDFLVKNDIIDPTNGVVKDKVGTALGLSVLEVAETTYQKTDDALEIKSLQQGDSDGFGDPGVIREKITSILFDKLMANPNVSNVDERLRTGFGGAGAQISPRLKSALEPLIYRSLLDSGMFEIIDLNRDDPNTEVKDERMVLTNQGEAYYLANRQILSDVFGDKRINISYTPVLDTAIPGIERELGDKARNISKKGKSSKNTIFESAVKMRLGSMPLRIDKESLTYVKMMVDQTMVAEETPNGTVYRLIDRDPKGDLFSTGVWASTLGLDQAKFIEFYAEALKRYEKLPNKEIKARDQAQKIMRQRMRHVARTVTDAETNDARTFYNKYFHASSVGRYFIRNTVLNSQNEKLVRNMVRNGKRTILNLNKINTPESKRIMKNWRYIIGKNLLDPSGDYNLTNGVRTEDMGVDAILNLSNRIFSDTKPGSVYDAWVKRGEALSKALELRETNPAAASDAFNAATLEGIHSKSFKKKDEWGYKMQSYIDVYRFDQAKKKGDAQLFEPRATTQHDGKQNGIAIQAMQLGDYESLSRTGLIFESEENVIPQGDLRDSFLDAAIDDIKTTFATEQDKAEFWLDFLQSIKDLPVDQRSSIIKDLSKTPMMETSYGMPPAFHMETALAFLKSADGKRLVDASRLTHSEVSKAYGSDEVKITADLNRIIGSGLLSIINIEQQALYKKAGLIWAMTGEDVALQGPLGTDIYMGAREYFETGETISLALPGGEVINVPLTESRYTGSSGKLVRRRVYDPKTNTFIKEERSKYGQLVANQLPVLTVQQIDAAIMANTIMNVNKDPKNPAFLIPVHDAIITDATSVDLYHDEINKQFVKVNNDYSISKAIINGLKKAKNTLKGRADKYPNEVADVSYNSKYRAVHDYLMTIHQEVENPRKVQLPEMELYVDPKTGKPSKMETTEGVTTKRALILADAIEAGWSPEGSDMKLLAIWNVINTYERDNLVLAKLEMNHKANEANKARIMKAIKPKPYPYN